MMHANQGQNYRHILRFMGLSIMMTWITGFAQYSGTITDSDGSAINGCEVVLASTEEESTTGADGRFSIGPVSIRNRTGFNGTAVSSSGRTLNIELNRESTLRFEIHNLRGRLVRKPFSEKLDPGTYTINPPAVLPGLSAGIYVVTVYTGTSVHRFKLNSIMTGKRGAIIEAKHPGTAALAKRTAEEDKITIQCGGYNTRIIHTETAGGDLGTFKVYQAKPNMVFIMSDDHAMETISAYGSYLKDVSKTPSIDRLAEQGMLFRHFLVNNSICSPSRASFMTGQYSHNNGVKNLGGTIRDTSPWLTKLLQAADYQVAVYGKWHMHPDPLGTDDFWIENGQGHYFNPQFHGTRGSETVQGYSTDIYTDVALDWMNTRRDKSKPFALFLHFKAPHHPYDYPDKVKDLNEGVTMPEPPNLYEDLDTSGSALKQDWITGTKFHMVLTGSGSYYSRHVNDDDWNEAPATTEKEKWAAAYQHMTRKYIKCITVIDENVGRVMDHIDSIGAAENTIFVYTSDQGYWLGQHGYYDKRLILDESLHTPFIIRYPQEIKAGTENRDLVMNLDYVPTILDMTGLTTPENVDGSSFRTMLQGDTASDWRDAAFYNYWSTGPNHYGIRTDRYTWSHYGNNRDLYDNLNDPWQMINQADNPEYADVAAGLETQLQEIITDIGISGQLP